MKKHFKINSSPIIKSITVCVTALFAFFIMGLIIQAINPDLVETKLYYTLAAVLLIVIYFYVYSRSPKDILISDEREIIIHFPFNQKSFKICEISSISPVNRIATLTFGSNGFWGIIGFSNGDVKTYIKNSSEIILIKLEKKEILISCNNHLEFIREIQHLLSNSKQNTQL